MQISACSALCASYNLQSICQGDEYKGSYQPLSDVANQILPLHLTDREYHFRHAQQ